jgi:AcrR family transcriptional regulator
LAGLFPHRAPTGILSTGDLSKGYLVPKSSTLDLKFVPREGGYTRGQDGFELILKTALAVLIDEGYQALTLRQIAKVAGMKAGNITYYFKSKDDLVRALFDSVANSYEAAIEAIVREGGDDPALKLANLIGLILDDITSKETTRIFPELWALSNHDRFVKERLYELYDREHAYFDVLVKELNPALPTDQRRVVTAFIIASLEGTTIFAGHGKPWRASMPEIKAIATQSLINYVKNAKLGSATGGKTSGRLVGPSRALDGSSSAGSGRSEASRRRAKR